MKSVALIVFALLIDGVQAGFSLALTVMSAFPGTFFGAGAGCLAGKSILGDFGCAIGGFVFGVLGSIPLVNAALDPVTVPVGIMLGFVISICISCTLGAGFIGLLIYSQMFYPKFLLPGGITEMLPGFSLIPTWTAVAILSAIEKSKREGSPLGAVASVAVGSSSPTSLIGGGGSSKPRV